jgi:hypothetical protein
VGASSPNEPGHPKSVPLGLAFFPPKKLNRRPANRPRFDLTCFEGKFDLVNFH